MSDGVNDGVELGLMPGFDPLGVDSINEDNLITAPTANESKTKPTIVTDVSEKLNAKTTEASDFFGDNYVLGEVPDIQANIKLIDSSKSALEGLEYARCELVGNCSISKEDYVQIEPILGNAKPNLSIGEFSKCRSRTNYSAVLESLNNAIEIEKKSVVCAYESIFDEALEDLEEFVEHFEKHYLPFIKENLDKVADAFGDMLDSLSTSKNVYVYDSTKSLVNIRDTTILDSPVLDELVDSDNTWHHGLKIIRTAISIPALAHFIWTVNKGKKGHYHLFAQTASEGMCYAKEMTLGDLVNFYRSKEVSLTLLNEMLVESQGAVEELRNLKDRVKDKEESEVIASAFNSSDRLVHISSSFMYNKSVTDNLGLLSIALVHCNEVLAYMSKN